MSDKNPLAQKPFLLLTNDDGYQAKGINELIAILKPYYEICVVAPEGGQSGKGCSITADRPFSYRKIEKEGFTLYACNGTPVDCVKIAVGKLLSKLPDLVISGINHGSNASVNAHYSGTVGAAFEACMKGIPAIAFSLCDHSPKADFSSLGNYILQITAKVLKDKLPTNSVLNVNFPKAKEFKGIKVCRMAKSQWINEIEPCPHPFGLDFNWLGGMQKNLEPESQDTDLWALQEGYIAITPITIDVTNYSLLQTLSFE